MGSISDRVGIIVPAFSDTVHWFDNVRTVNDALEAITTQNVFLDRNKVTAFLRGRVPSLHEIIPPGEILQVSQVTQNSAVAESRKAATGFRGETFQRKVIIRFLLFEFGEEPIELYASNYEPLQVFFNIIRKKLLSMGCIDKDDELDFNWPHLRWVPRGSVKVKNIRTMGFEQKVIGCFVRKRGDGILSHDPIGPGKASRQLRKSATQTEETLASGNMSLDLSPVIQDANAERRSPVYENGSDLCPQLVLNSEHAQQHDVRCNDKRPAQPDPNSPGTDCSKDTSSIVDFTPNMLSSLNAPESDREPVVNESKPSLTVYAHKIATQTTEVRSLLSSSLAHIAEDRNQLRKVLQDTKSLINGHEDVNKEFGNVVTRLDSLVAKQQATISQLTQTITSVEAAHIALEDNMSALSIRLSSQNRLIQTFAEEQKESAAALSMIHEKLDNVISEMTKPRLVSKLQFNHPDASLETVPTLPAPTGQPPVLSDSENTESSVSVIVETPAPANKPAKKPGTAKKEGSSDGSKPARKKVLKKASLNKAKPIPKPARHRSISLGPAIEPTPDEILNNPYINERDLDGQASADAKKSGAEASEGIPASKCPAVSKEVTEQVTLKKQTKKRILAGPATQEAWEMDTTTT
ncbi:hypothetical protein Dda_4955 [Drechslerella dactyloides]|uniref:Uncharacterized protein n=1 Tax=Drechslerella dactyloides TaxID=74499 RepID=A0AAD6NIE4_DREDA|nr:hypothetical protein Dda_4955 [Drechslerella dactyloides]